MNFIRENLLKIIMLLGIIFILIIIMSACSKKDAPVQTKYETMENQLLTAANKFLSENNSLLPKEEDGTSKVTLNKLVRNGKIKELYANENNKVKCEGYVIVKKNEEDYSLIPFLKCGKYYQTRTLAQKILDDEKVVSTDDGLYKMGDEYVFRGENPNNYILMDQNIYRIISINSDNEIKAISTKRAGYCIWDDRYNSESEKNDGINIFEKSRLKDCLGSLYDAVDEDDEFFSQTEKKYIMSHDYCIGRLSNSEAFGSFNKEKECSETSNLKSGLITISEYLRVSTDSSCNSGQNNECQNYNYLINIDDYMMTLNASSDNTSEVYYVDEGRVDVQLAKRRRTVYPVIYLNKLTLYKSGNGSEENPYLVR